MGYRSDVKIMLEPKAYEMVMASIKAYNENNKKEGEYHYEFKPHQDKVNDEGIHIIEWDDVKWYNSYKDVQSVEDVLHKLNNLEDELTDGYAYKQIIVGEDNQTEEYSNDWDWGAGYDFYAHVEIIEPNGFKEI